MLWTKYKYLISRMDKFCTCNPLLIGAKLLPDFFLDEDPNALRDQLEEEGGKPAFGGESKASVASGPAKTFQQIQALLSEDLVKSIGGIFQFNLSGGFILYRCVKVSGLFLNSGF